MHLMLPYVSKIFYSLVKTKRQGEGGYPEGMPFRAISGFRSSYESLEKNPLA